jgi:hypothetical protein
MAERIIVMFAYHFPPENLIGAVPPYRFCKYLSEWIVCGAPQNSGTHQGVKSLPRKRSRNEIEATAELQRGNESTNRAGGDQGTEDHSGVRRDKPAWRCG